MVEASDVNNDTTSEWLKQKWPGVRKHYKDEDIFNADETGLFYKMSPNSTLKFKSEKCIGGKLSKERVTFLVCANTTGTERRDLLVVGKSKNPRSFKNVKILPVKYEANKKT